MTAARPLHRRVRYAPSAALAANELETYLEQAEIAEEDGFFEGRRGGRRLPFPHFLYCSELGADAEGGYVLTDWVIASSSNQFGGRCPTTSSSRPRRGAAHPRQIDARSSG